MIRNLMKFFQKMFEKNENQIDEVSELNYKYCLCVNGDVFFPNTRECRLCHEFYHVECFREAEYENFKCMVCSDDKLLTEKYKHELEVRCHRENKNSLANLEDSPVEQEENKIRCSDKIANKLTHLEHDATTLTSPSTSNAFEDSCATEAFSDVDEITDKQTFTTISQESSFNYLTGQNKLSKSPPIEPITFRYEASIVDETEASSNIEPSLIKFAEPPFTSFNSETQKLRNSEKVKKFRAKNKNKTPLVVHVRKMLNRTKRKSKTCLNWPKKSIFPNQTVLTNEFRKKVIQTLVRIFKTRINQDDSIKSGEELENLCKNIENELEKQLKDRKKYINQIKSIKFNIADAKNESFCMKILNGEIKPADLPRMKSSEMASDKVIEERNNELRNQLKEIEKFSNESLLAENSFMLHLQNSASNKLQKIIDQEMSKDQTSSTEAKNRNRVSPGETIHTLNHLSTKDTLLINVSKNENINKESSILKIDSNENTKKQGTEAKNGLSSVPVANSNQSNQNKDSPVRSNSISIERIDSGIQSYFEVDAEKKLDLERINSIIFDFVVEEDQNSLNKSSKTASSLQKVNQPLRVEKKPIHVSKMNTKKLDETKNSNLDKTLSKPLNSSQFKNRKASTDTNESNESKIVHNNSNSSTSNPKDALIKLSKSFNDNISKPIANPNYKIPKVEPPIDSGPILNHLNQLNQKSKNNSPEKLLNPFQNSKYSLSHDVSSTLQSNIKGVCDEFWKGQIETNYGILSARASYLPTSAEHRNFCYLTQNYFNSKMKSIKFKQIQSTSLYPFLDKLLKSHYFRIIQFKPFESNEFKNTIKIMDEELHANASQSFKNLIEKLLDLNENGRFLEMEIPESSSCFLDSFYLFPIKAKYGESAKFFKKQFSLDILRNEHKLMGILVSKQKCIIEQINNEPRTPVLFTRSNHENYEKRKLDTENEAPTSNKRKSYSVDSNYNKKPRFENKSYTQVNLNLYHSLPNQNEASNRSPSSFGYELEDVEETEKRRSREKNVKITGLKLSHDTRNDRSIVENLFKDIGEDRSKIKQVYRIEQEYANPRHQTPIVIAELRGKDDTLSVLQNAKKLKYSINFKHVYINPDLTQKQKLELKLREERDPRSYDKKNNEICIKFN